MRPYVKQKLRPLFFSMAICALVLMSSARVMADEKTPIFPIPQQLELTGDEFVLDESISIIVPEERSDEDIFLARFLVRELSDKYGIAVRIETGTDIPEDRKVVVMGSIENPLIKQFSKENKLDINEKSPGAEGYVLHVSNNKIFVAGWDDAGAFMGLQSLRQLIEAGNGEKVGGIKVRDWPNLPFRAIRLYVPGPENIAFFKRFLRDFMALYKYNRVILEVNCMRLDRHPEVNAGWIEFANDLQYSRSNRPVGIRGEGKTSSHYDAGDGLIIEKDDMKDIVELANQNFIEVIPEIPSLTHAYYLLTRHPELSEYPGDNWPDTYCPSIPASYDLMFDIYDEYIEVMQPKMIHIGHDEWRMPLDVCPHCKDKNYFDLYAQDVNKIYDYMAQKGIKVAMWGDHLLESVRNAGPREGVSSTGIKYQKPGALPPSVVKESIPKDILIFNWFWVDQEKDKEVDDFGFTQLYGNFKSNISNWDERIQKVDVVGGAPSSWAATTEYNFGKDLLIDFLGCANLLWSTHTLNQSDLPSIASELMPSIRAGLSPRRIPSEDGDPVVPVNITSHLNWPADSDVFNVNLSSLKSGEVNSRAKVFNLVNPAEASGHIAVAVGSIGVGENPLPAKVKGIPIEEDVSSLVFLHACALPAMNQKAYFNIPDFFDTADLLGWYEVVYEDGFSVTVPIQYGVNILEWNPGGEGSIDRREGKTGSPQNAYAYEADPVNCSSDMENNPITLYAYEWINPRFGKVIKEVNLHGTINYQSAQASGNPVTKPMPSNAILLSSISKVIKRVPYRPKK
jgi:hypothetical protein